MGCACPGGPRSPCRGSISSALLGSWRGKCKRCCFRDRDCSDGFLRSCVFLDNPFPKDQGPSSDAQTGMGGWGAEMLEAGSLGT